MLVRNAHLRRTASSAACADGGVAASRVLAIGRKEMTTLLHELSLLAIEAEQNAESARAHGADAEAALQFKIEEAAKNLRDLLEEVAA